jgi:thiol-disulfide isomerase/thioredoxin
MKRSGALRHCPRLRVLVVSVAALWCAGVAADTLLGKPAPALLATQLDGAPFDLAAQRGKVVIVNFWASWCAPCRAEMPLLNRFYLEHRAQGLVLIGVSIDDAQDRATVARIMHQFSYPAVLAANARVDGFGAPLAVPMTWVVDRSGVLRARLLAGNAVSEQSLTQIVLPLLPARGRH